MSHAAKVINLEEFRKQREPRHSPLQPQPRWVNLWTPVWVWFMVWPT